MKLVKNALRMKNNNKLTYNQIKVNITLFSYIIKKLSMCKNLVIKLFKEHHMCTLEVKIIKIQRKKYIIYMDIIYQKKQTYYS